MVTADLTTGNVELVRELLLGYADHGLGEFIGRLAAVADPALVWREDPAWPDREMVAGIDEIRRLLETRLDSTDFKLEVDEVVGKDDRVLALLRWVTRGRASGAETKLDFATVTTIREGRVAAIDFYLDRAAACRASRIDT